MVCGTNFERAARTTASLDVLHLRVGTSINASKQREIENSRHTAFTRCNTQWGKWLVCGAESVGVMAAAKRDRTAPDRVRHMNRRGGGDLEQRGKR